MSEPLPLCHLNGKLLPLREARISPLDRSFLFGDGVYEVIAVHGGHAPQLAANIARLARSLGELKIRNPYQAGQWAELIRELAAANGGGDLYVYLQGSPGSEYGRNHPPPPDGEPPGVGFFAPPPPPPPG